MRLNTVREASSSAERKTTLTRVKETPLLANSRDLTEVGEKNSSIRSSGATTSRARAAGALPPHEEQRVAIGEPGSAKRHRRGPRAEVVYGDVRISSLTSAFSRSTSRSSSRARSIAVSSKSASRQS